MTLQEIKSRLREFRRAGHGIQALHIVIICAIAANTLVAFLTVGDEIFNWCTDNLGELLDWSIG